MSSTRKRLAGLRALLHRQATIELAAAERRLSLTAERLAETQQECLRAAAAGGGLSHLLLSEQETAAGLRTLAARRLERQSKVANESRCRLERRQAETLLERERQRQRREQHRREQKFLDEWSSRLRRRT
jgi:hypothetical protein